MDSRKVGRYFYDKFQYQRRQKGEMRINLTQVLKGRSRKESARLFYEILVSCSFPACMFIIVGIQHFKLTNFLFHFCFVLVFICHGLGGIMACLAFGLEVGMNEVK